MFAKVGIRVIDGIDEFKLRIMTKSYTNFVIDMRDVRQDFKIDQMVEQNGQFGK